MATERASSRLLYLLTAGFALSASMGCSSQRQAPAITASEYLRPHVDSTIAGDSSEILLKPIGMRKVPRFGNVIDVAVMGGTSEQAHQIAECVGGLGITSPQEMFVVQSSSDELVEIRRIAGKIDAIVPPSRYTCRSGDTVAYLVQTPMRGRFVNGNEYRVQMNLTDRARHLFDAGTVIRIINPDSELECVEMRVIPDDRVAEPRY